MKTIKNIFVFGAMLLVPLGFAHADWKVSSGNSSIYSAEQTYINNPRHNNFKHCDSPRPRFYNHSNNKSNSYAYSQIKNGVRNGELSAEETRELREYLSDLKRKENHYWADGYLSNWERESLREDYQDFQHELRHELNDGEHRW